MNLVNNIPAKNCRILKTCNIFLQTHLPIFNHKLSRGIIRSVFRPCDPAIIDAYSQIRICAVNANVTKQISAFTNAYCVSIVDHLCEGWIRKHLQAK